MKSSLIALGAFACASIAAPTPTPAPAPVQVPAPYVAPAPAPVYEVAPVAPAPTAASTAPYAPLTDAILQADPAAQGSMSSVLTIPHRWADKRVAFFQWAGANSVQSYGTFDRFFVGFQAKEGQGDLTGGYTTPDWAAGLTVNFGKQWTSNSDSINHQYVQTKKQSQTAIADGFVLLGSLKLNDLHLWANVAYRSAGFASTSAEGQTPSIAIPAIGGTPATTIPGTPYSYASEYDSAGTTIGVRTYVTGEEGLAWRATVGYGDMYLRPSKSLLSNNDSEFTNADIAIGKITGDVGYRFAAPNKTMFTVGVNTAFNMINGKPNRVTYRNAASPDTIGKLDIYDYYWQISLRPNVGLLLPLTERWTFLGGAGLTALYGSSDRLPGDDETKISNLATALPSGNVGIRYAKDIWAVEAQVSSDYLSQGPYFLSGNQTPNVLAGFALTVNLK